jgi:hypothetical protein
MKLRMTGIGTVVARRELLLSGRKKVTVEIGKPRKFRGSPDYFCPFRIRGIGDDFLSRTGGIDAIQALELVMTHIGSLLYYSEEAKAGKLTWDAGRVDGDLGFPLMEVAKKDVLPEKVNHIYLYKPYPPRPTAKHRKRKSKSARK